MLDGYLRNDMSTRFYDTAVLEKIKTWVRDENMTITSPDETRRLFEYVADTNNDTPIKLPLIALRRDPAFRVLNTNKRALSYNGALIDSNVKILDSALVARNTSLNAIPIQLDYQIDIYTRRYAEADEYVRNFVFNIINYPELKVKIPYNDLNWVHKSNIRLNPDISDNSSIPERLMPGQFTRFTIRFSIDDAYLWSVPVKDSPLISGVWLDVDHEELTQIK